MHNSPLAARQIIVNRIGRAAAGAHGENHGGSSCHNVAAREDPPARSALRRAVRRWGRTLEVQSTVSLRAWHGGRS